MADTKVSSMSAATTLAGTELFYGVQSSADVKVTGAQIATMGWSLTGTLTSKTIDAGSNTITNLTTSMFASNVIDTDSSLAANSDTRIASQKAIKAYIDTVATGLDAKASVFCATTANITLSGEQTVDGQTTSTSRVLVKNQSTQSQNGIYVSGSGSWTRATDADAWTELPGAFCFVEKGTTNGDCGFVCTSDAGGTLGSTAVTFVQFNSLASYSAGTGLSLSGSTFSVDSTVATLTGSQTLSNKTLTSPVIDSTIPTVAGAIGYGAFLNYGDGANNHALVDVDSAQTLTNKTLTNPIVGTQSAGNSSTRAASTAFVAAAVAAMMPNYLTGLTLSTAGSSSTFGIALGAANDTTSALIMQLASAYTKTTGSWTVGSGNGALDTGTIANNTWYHVFQIARSDTGVVDVLISTSATSPTLPTNYDRKRRIGSMKTDGSAKWVKFVQNGDNFMWDVPVNDVSATNPGTSAVTRTLTVPPGVIVQAIVIAGFNAAAQTDNPGAVYISDLALSDTAPLSNSATSVEAYSTAAGQVIAVSAGFVNTSTSAQVRSRVQISTASTILFINTNGWNDLRGK